MSAGAKKNPKFFCKSCGITYPKWLGQCESCGEWNSIEEKVAVGSAGELSVLKRLSEFSKAVELKRSSTGIDYLDSVLKGGMPDGTIILLAGEPGIGKSTLLFQMILAQLRPSIYVTAEESIDQVAQRFQNFSKPASDDLFLVSESSVEKILDLMAKKKPSVMVVDSIQMLVSEDAERARGGNASLRDMTDLLVSRAKELGIILWIVGHVNKEGDIAGPKVLEHLVDIVLTFHLAEDQRLRLLHVQKNRYGPSGEVVLLEIGDKGLKESSSWNSFMRPHQDPVPGCSLTCAVFGSRLVCIEIQALVVDSYFPSPKRSSPGFDINRLHLLLAVLEKRLKIPFSRQDVYLNVVGGLRVTDPVVDLAVAAALVSAFTETPVLGAFYLGEIGLTGEIRQVPRLQERARFIRRSGDIKIHGPKSDEKDILKYESHLSVTDVFKFD